MKEKMYVRCSVDTDYPSEPRDFLLGKIKSINDFTETAVVEFFDIQGLNQYYNMPSNIEVSLSRLRHAAIERGSTGKYNDRFYQVVGAELNKDDEYYYYYLLDDEKQVIKVSESEITASYNASEVNPAEQMVRYEFQNPMWYFGRRAVVNTSRTIEQAFYGFKVLSGCKIFLRPHQLKTVMRCLSGKYCRYMIADEVGLGKTIEALSVLKVYLSDKKNKNVVICVPDALSEQWKTEMAFKFRMFEGTDKNGNTVSVYPVSRMLTIKAECDFIIMDEVHGILENIILYTKALQLSRNTKNIIMLSATPVQSRNEEYHKLLSLIQPEKYQKLSEEEFLSLLELQNKIVRKIHAAVEYLSDYKEVIEESENEHTEDTEETFEELAEVIEGIARAVNDKMLTNDLKNLDYDGTDFAVPLFEKMIAYICEAYQLERCVIRNRRKPEDSNAREFVEIPYDMNSDFNNTEFRLYGLLSEWIESLDCQKTDFNTQLMPLISSFFSSSSAFHAALNRITQITVPDEIKELSKKWLSEEKRTVSQIKDIMKDPFDSFSRIVAICDYLEQEAYDKKVLVFTHFAETHDLYKKVMVSFFGDRYCAFFRDGMSSDELELNTYQFQNNEECHIMLSDETGGEGRNFQMADEMICIDLPWSANTIEQRIGRLDRIGRVQGRPVVTAVVYAENTVEHDLLHIWNKGLHIFNQSQSGLEIIMNDIDQKIRIALAEDFKFGLASLVDEMVEEIHRVEKQVKEERHFDIAAYQFQSVNRQIEKIVEKYNKAETELFRNSMMSWASMAGFIGSKVSDDIVRFNLNSFSVRSAYNTILVPPDMELMIGEKLNQMQNRIRILNGDKEIKNNPNVVQGTFSRRIALKSDYLHFFAPGDELYDSIVNNAISAYKGRCAAFAIQTSFDWEGFVFNWYIRPDELRLLENNIPVLNMNLYLGFIPSDIITVPICLNGDDTVDAGVVNRELNRIADTPKSEMKLIFANYGKRSPCNDFLDIKQSYMISNLSWFKETHTRSAWETKVRSSYKTARAAALEEFRKRIKIKALRDTLIRELGAEAASEYFGSSIDVDDKKTVNQAIFDAIAKPKLILDSVCYVRMIKND